MTRVGDYRLRSVELADADALLRWRNADGNRAFMYNTALIELPEHVAWLTRELNNTDSRHLIFEHGDTPVGYASLSEISERHRRCSWGFNLTDSPQPKGSGARMLACVADYVFGSLKLEKICSQVLSFNGASLAVHQRLGFESEGLQRRHIHRDDGVFDIQLFALFAEQWQQARQGLLSELFDA